MNFNVSYGITRRLAGVKLDEARARVVEALKGEGFGVLTEIDVQATMKKKLGAEMAPYLILGACNPGLAHRALTAAPGIGLLLPCNVVVAEDGAECVISAVSPRAMFSVVEAVPGLDGLAEEAEDRLRRAIEGA